MNENNEKRTKKQAIALNYEEIDTAPKLVGKGKGYIAEEIIRLAKENNIPIQTDPSLVNILSQLEIDQEIPPALYEVVAEIFAFVYQLDKNN